MMCMGVLGVLPLQTTTMLRSRVFPVNARSGGEHDNLHDFGHDFRKAGLQRPQGGSHANVFPRIPDLPRGACHGGGVRACRRGGDVASRQGRAVRLDLHAARRRHRDRPIRQARADRRAIGIRRRRQLQQAMADDGVDIGIGSGPGMAFTAKGAPVKAVAAMAGIPTNMALMVNYNSAIKSVDDLKGKRIGVTTVGSLTDWIAKRIGVLKGWGPKGIDIVAIGGMEPARAAMKINQIDGYISSLESGFALEEAKEWRVITTATPFVDPFITHVFFAPEELIEKRPQAIRAFLQGWFNTIAFMKANKAKTVDITAKVI